MIPLTYEENNFYENEKVCRYVKKSLFLILIVAVKICI